VKCSNNKMRSNCVKRSHPLILPLSYFTSLSLSLSLTSVPPFIPLSLLLNVRHILPASFLFSSIHHIVPDLVSLPLPMFLFRWSRRESYGQRSRKRRPSVWARVTRSSRPHRGSRGNHTVLYCTALYCTALYCTELHCTVLYCTAPH
jgi:hypothetical protein